MPIRRAMRQQYSAEKKIRVVPGSLKGKDSVAELCRCEGIAQDHYYNFCKEFLKTGKKHLAGETAFYWVKLQSR